MTYTLIPLKVLCLLTIFCLYGSLSYASVNSKPFVVPELKQWTGKDGNFTPGTNAKIVCTSANPELLRIAQMFADDYQQMFGKTLSVTQGKATPGDFILSLSADKKLGEEGYEIKITDRITTSAPTLTGLYWSTRTLLQIAEQSQEHSFPKGIIRDYPDYSIRGFMIDCGRKFIPMSYLQDLVKIMAYYKMNTLQVHLNDNGFKQYFDNNWDKTYAAFRLESETYPGLTARDGSYSKKEFIDFQKQAVFVGKRVHIGTDEYSNAKKEVVEKFRAFTDHYIRLVEGFGKQAVIWGALTHAKGDTPVKSENIIMNAWYNGYADPATMIKDGYQLISIPDAMVYIVPLAGYYQDYLNEVFLYKEWTPAHIGKAVFEEKHPAILGGMFAIWNDHAGNGISVKDIHHRVFPALQTLAVKTWTGKETSLPFEVYNEKRSAISEAPGVNQLGRIGKSPALVYERSTVAPGSTSTYPEIGYNYTVSFDITGAPEKSGTELFRSPNAVFYLADPIRGMMGFARDGYLNTFPYKVNPGEKATIQIEGDHRSTTLRVNGKVVEEMNIQKCYFNAGKDSMSYIRTLVFPLEKAGNFNSRIENLKVHNYRVSK